MPQIRIPDFVGHSMQREQQRQNAMVNVSNMRTAQLQQERLGMESQEAQRSVQKRAELEGLLSSTPEADRDRVGLEWSKVNHPDLYGKLTAMHVQKLQQLLPLNPQQALASFERATGEKVQYDPASGIVDIPTEGGVLKISSRGTMEHIKTEKPLAIRTDEAKAMAQATAEGRAAGTPPPPVRPDHSLSPTELFAKDPKQFEDMEEAKARAGSKYRRLVGTRGATQELQTKRLRKSIKDKKDKALATLEREFRSPAAFGRFDPMGDEELTNRKQQIQDDFENDLMSAGFDATPFSYSDQPKATQLSNGSPKTGGITRDQALQELRRRGVIR